MGTGRHGLGAALAEAGLALRDDGLWTDPSGDLGAVVGPVGVLVGWLDLRWEGPAHPQPWLRDVIHLPPADVEGDLVAQLRVVDAARRAALLECRYCKRRMVSGRMHADDVCQSCAERHLGVVY